MNKKKSSSSMQKNLWGLTVLEQDEKFFVNFDRDLLNHHFDVIHFNDLKSLENAFTTDESPHHIVLNHQEYTDIASQLSLVQINVFIFCENQSIEQIDSFYSSGVHEVFNSRVTIEEFVSRVKRASPEFSLSHPAFHPILQNNINELTFKESLIFGLFLNSPKRRISRDTILHNVWKGVKVQDKTVDVHIHNLRKKILKEGFEIVSAGLGHWELKDNKTMS